MGRDDGYDGEKCEDLHRSGICVYINGFLKRVLMREQCESERQYENDRRCANERMWIKQQRGNNRTEGKPDTYKSAIQSLDSRDRYPKLTRTRTNTS